MRFFLEKKKFIQTFLLANLLILIRLEAVVLYPLFLGFFHKEIKQKYYALIPYGLLAVLGLNYLAAGSFASNSSVAKKFWAHPAFHDYFLPLDLVEKTKVIILSLFQVNLSIEQPIFWLSHVAGQPAKDLMILVWVLFCLIVFLCFPKIKIIIKHPLIMVFGIYSIITYGAYKTIYFTPNDFNNFTNGFPVYDYQAIWYFAPLTVLIGFVVYGLTLAGIKSIKLRLISVVLFWLMVVGGTFFVRERMIQPTTSELCATFDKEMIYVSKNDNRSAYDTDAKIILLDGLVNGENIKNGTNYLDILKERDLSYHINEIDAGYINQDAIDLISYLEHGNSLNYEEEEINFCKLGKYHRLINFENEIIP